MDYQATLAYLDEVQTRGIKLGLDTMHALLADMGEPQQAFPSVVVAGTNGKGSVCAFLASILKQAGWRTGLYTSPHLVRYEERIAVDGDPVTEEEFAQAVTVVRNHVEALMARGSLASHPTHFEILTAAAFHHFKMRGIDVGVLEVGMGGRLDAVATARTVVAVITNVSLEHTQYLGDTVAAIAREKAGIIREGCWVVTAETDPSVLAVLSEAATGRGVRLIERHSEAVVTHAASAASGHFGLSTRSTHYGELIQPMAGRHQVENATLAVLTAEALREALGIRITTEAIVEGLARAQWPGRLQVAGQRPLLLLDGAHNPAGCEALARALKDMADGGAFRRLALIFGVLQDKDVEPMARHLFPRAERIFVTRGRSERFRDPDQIATLARALGADPSVQDDPAAAMKAARAWAGPDDAICLCGSLYLVGDAMSALGIEPFNPSI
ncbi:MAG TPA: folylpolyglutamate synthase/dihydrofolate synthase family protein [Patescibacteria group bacterium]|jgi:dihydrofolate synthase/folylpolyglutamate synthase|nr:folylpolyglutamate synthase/dihydrofolate synthase family protein [Patescibacteria group bacterium]